MIERDRELFSNYATYVIHVMRFSSCSPIHLYMRSATSTTFLQQIISS